MPGVQQQAPQGFQCCSESERRRHSTTRRCGNHRDAKRLWTACKTRDSEPCCMKQESPGFCRGDVQLLSTSFSRVAVVAGSRLSLTKTVSPCCSITMVPSSVFHSCRPLRRAGFGSPSAPTVASGCRESGRETSCACLYRCCSDWA